MSNDRGFSCVHCGGPTLVSDRRGKRRRRKCVSCDERFTTYELRDEEYQSMKKQIEELTLFRDRMLQAIGDVPKEAQ